MSTPSLIDRESMCNAGESSPKIEYEESEDLYCNGIY